MRTLSAVLVFVVCLVTSGCSICAPGYLCDYAGVGGKWQRADPENGRVGSILSDAGSSIYEGDDTAVIVSPGEYYSEGAEVLEMDALQAPDASSMPMEFENTAPNDGVIILGEDW